MEKKFKEEIGTMLEDYIKNKGVKLDKEYFSGRIYFYTSGYPFLVSKLCKIIDEKIMLQNKVWENEYLDLAVKELLKEDNTNFQSLIKNVENNKELYKFVSNIVLDKERIAFISPVINGTGFAFKEVQGGEEKCFDIVITYNKKR